MRGGVYMSVSGSAAAGALIDFLENKYTQGQRVNKSNDSAGVKVMYSRFGYAKVMGGRSTQTPKAQIDETVNRVVTQILKVWNEASPDQRLKLATTFGLKFHKYQAARGPSGRLFRRLKPDISALTERPLNIPSDPTVVSAPQLQKGRGDKATLLERFMEDARSS